MIKEPLVSVQVDDEVIEKLIIKKIHSHLKDIENSKLFYTMDDLQEITGMSKGFIEQRFFHDPRFVQIRRKVGRKWLFPVNEARMFLQQWILEQPNE